MATVLNDKSVEYKNSKSKLEAFEWTTSSNISDLLTSKHLDINIRILDPDKFTYPYHFHFNAEEVFVILEGEATLRTPDGLKKVYKGDVIFFEIGESGAHQMYNHTDKAVKFLDIKTEEGFDVCEYPDSNKINILPDRDIFKRGSSETYFNDEDKVRDIWKGLNITK